MPRGDQLGRQWKIIQTLLASKRGKSVSEIASNLDCHPRTVYRDLEALEKAGFPIYTEMENNTSYWSILDTVKHQIPIPLNLTELLALYFSKDMLKILRGTVFYESLESLFNKIKSTLPPQYLAQLDRMGQSLEVAQQPYKNHGDLEPLIDRIQSAIEDRKYTHITYYALSRRTDSRRTVAPYKVWFFGGTFYMVGYCRLREDIRVFAVDRIKSIDISDEEFPEPENLEMDTLMQSSFGAFRGAATRVKIWFSKRVAGYIAEKVWHQTQELDHQVDGSVIFSAEVAGTEEIMFWVMQWGSDAVVLSPDRLKKDIRSEVMAMQENYSNDD
ncbi:MAG: transcriptional regulator [Desulfobacteraceae bacterium]|nr:transcriptional regulator [Desulfobacteraceae bacterium]